MKKVLSLALLMLLSLNVSAQSWRSNNGTPNAPDAFFVVVSTPGELKKKTPEKMVPAIRRLKVDGVLSVEDVKFLKELSARYVLKDTLGHKLEPFFDLDLSDATIPARGTSAKNRSYIPDGFLSNSKLLRKIILPVNTEWVGDRAFMNCDKLTEVQMPMSVNHLGHDAFKGDKLLTGISFPKALKTIGNGCFEDCGNLQQIVLFDGVETIGSSAFKNTAITEIRLPETLKSIGEEAFANTAIAHIELPERIQQIDGRAFVGCNTLQKISVSTLNSNYSDMDGILVNKQKTVIVRVPASVTGTYMIPEGITGVDNYAFAGCEKIRELQFPNSLTRIGEGAFKGCKNISKMELPASLQTLGKAAFASSGLNSINLSGVKQIGQQLFLGCQNLSEVTLPMLEEIPTGMFEGCTALTAIALPTSLKSISDDSFKGCKNLQAIDFPQTMASIGEETFRGCKALKAITFPQSVTTIGHKAFYDCDNLQSVTCPWAEPLKINDITNDKSIVLRVPAGSEKAYEKAKGWKKFKKIENY